MKRLILFIFTLALATSSFAINGKFIATGGELMFTFVKDSLYVDMAGSGCGISAYKLGKGRMNSDGSISYDAYETYLEYDQEKYRMVLITIKREKHGYRIMYSGRDKDRKYNSHEVYHIKRMLK